MSEFIVANLTLLAVRDAHVLLNVTFCMGEREKRCHTQV